MGRICVNRSGQSWPVYETNTGGTVIGNLNPNEIFTWISGTTWPGDVQRIYFKDARGVLKYGFVLHASNTDTFASFSDFGLYRVNINNKNCAVFKTRRYTNIYDTNGNPYRAVDPYTGKVIMGGTLPINSYVGTVSGTSGDSHPDWMYVDCFGPNDPSFGPGFIDVGLKVSSSPSAINLESSL